MKKALKWLDCNFEAYMIVIIFYSMVSLVTAQVFLRYFFNFGLSWGEEVAKLMFVWIMYFGFSIATKNNRHIRISYFVNKLSDKGQKYVMILCDVLFLIFSIFIFYAISMVARSVYLFNDQLVSIDVSMNVLYGAALVGFALMIYRIISNIIYKIKHINDSLEVFENFGGVYTSNNTIAFDAGDTSEEIAVDELELQNTDQLLSGESEE